MKETEAIARSLTGAAPGSELTLAQLEAAEEFVATLLARGFSVVSRFEAEQTARIQRKTGGTHPVAPGLWHVSAENGWVGLWAGKEETSPGMFCPGEAREIGMSLIVFAEQEERKRR